jgi:hypothetical protein
MPRALDIALPQGISDSKARLSQAPQGQKASAEDALRQKAQAGMDFTADLQDQDDDARADGQYQQDHQAARDALADPA